jgi:hypothetical protein
VPGYSPGLPNPVFVGSQSCPDRFEKRRFSLLERNDEIISQDNAHLLRGYFAVSPIVKFFRTI